MGVGMGEGVGEGEGELVEERPEASRDLARANDAQGSRPAEVDRGCDEPGEPGEPGGPGEPGEPRGCARTSLGADPGSQGQALLLLLSTLPLQTLQPAFLALLFRPARLFYTFCYKRTSIAESYV